ncbi:MAG: GntR family transcriptional regulator [Proteobacteria bacterium]|nr:GntR family transcriptional regulator [Pseudomonadota bacterium]
MTPKLRPAPALLQDEQTGNLSDRAYDSIKSLIVSRTLRGGEMVREIPLAESLGISRTPLREALQRLEGEGLVIKGAGRSYLVRKVDLAEYLQSIRVREILEPEAAAMATGRIPLGKIRAVGAEIDALVSFGPEHTAAHWRSDDQVHELMTAYCGNDVLARMIQSLRVTTRLFESARLSARLELDSAEHRAIIDALEQQDAKLVRRAVANHIRSLVRFALETVR